jgi:hypothetical protein
MNAIGRTSSPITSWFSQLGLAGSGWFEAGMVRVTEFWEMLSRPRFMALDANGGVVRMRQARRESIRLSRLANSGKTQQTGKPRVRVGRHRYARMHLITGTDILAGPYELPINRLPIVRVEGRIVRVGDDRYRYSLVRWAKDSARMRNYWRSVWVEKLAMAPKAKWLAEDAAVEGYEDDFRDAHLSQDSLLKYKQGAKHADARAAAAHRSRVDQRGDDEQSGHQGYDGLAGRIPRYSVQRGQR